MKRLLLTLLCLLWAAPSAYADAADDAQLVALERLRMQVAGEVQLAVYDLLDELVYHWTQSPPFGAPVPVFVADVTVPVGLGTGLEGLAENHLATLLLANPSAHVTLSHCPSCTAVLIHSGPKGTVVSRGLDNPEALAKIGGAGGRHGLYIDITAEGSWLVLRARITKLTPALPIVWSRTISSAVGTASMLRSPSALKSASAARREYLNVLQDRGPVTVPVRFAVRSYEAGSDGLGPAPAPIIWMQTGLEYALTQARAWTGSAIIGYAWLPGAYDGLMVQARMSRLISGPTRSLTGPDVSMFFGGALMTLDGPAITPFQTGDMDQILRAAAGSESSRVTFGGLHIGLEFRIGNRIGGAVFLENMPAYNGADEIGVFWDVAFVDFHSLGAEVSFCF